MQKSDSLKNVVITFHEGYLHIRHPENFVLFSRDIEALWQNLFEACKIHKCNRVLNEGNIDLSNLRAFDSYTAGTQAGEIHGLRMACLFPNVKPDEKAEFFKTVASNRGAKVEFFTQRTDALEWLGVCKNIQ